MNTGLTIIYNSFLYYCCLLLLTCYILNCIPRKKVLLSSFFTFIPLILTAITNIDAVFVPVYIAFTFSQFPLLKLAFKGVKIRHLILSYILLYSINMIVTSSVVSVTFIRYQNIDVIINTITAVLCLLVCLTKIRYTIQRALKWTPRYVMVISALLLIMAATMSVLVSGFAQSIFPDKWIRLIQVITPFLLMAICVVVPVIFIISISNTRLKTLTADYEQQIHAQAEHYKNLAEANYEVRRFRHDFKNIRIAIEKLLERGEYDEALKLIHQCDDTLEHPGGFHSAFDTGNGIADALLTDKQAKAANHNTQILFHGAIPSDFLSPTDLCVILGNSLDNALDACQKLPDHDHKTVSVSCKCSGGFLFLSITNPIGERILIRNNHIATTKENKTLHGFGLYSLHSIVKKYDGELQLSATDDSFTVNIDLCVAKPSPKTAIL